MSYYEFHGLTAFEVESRIYDLEGVSAVHLVDYIGGGLFRLHVLGEVPPTWEDAKASEIPCEWREDDPIYKTLAYLLNLRM